MPWLHFVLCEKRNASNWSVKRLTSWLENFLTIAIPAICVKMIPFFGDKCALGFLFAKILLSWNQGASFFSCFKQRELCTCFHLLQQFRLNPKHASLVPLLTIGYFPHFTAKSWWEAISRRCKLQSTDFRWTTSIFEQWVKAWPDPNSHRSEVI